MSEFVTIITPALNEEPHIGRLIDSVVASPFPKDRLELFVVDGGSRDRTIAVVQEYQRKHPWIRLLHNPRKIIPTAMNLGLAAARGEVVLRMDAHSAYPPGYIDQCVDLLRTSDAQNVGGVIEATGTSYVGRAIAVAAMHPFGVGDAHYRIATKQRYVDTVYPGAWRTATLRQLGGFAEEWEANEDYELNVRIREAAGRILLNPAIRCRYFVRENLGALSRQYFRYGYWKVRTLKRHPWSWQSRQLAAPLLVLSLALSALLLAGSVTAAMTVPAIYLVALLVASVHAANRAGWRYLPMLPLAFAAMHLSWGTGFWASVAGLAFGRGRRAAGNRGVGD